MLKRIKQIITTAAITLGLVMPVMAPALVHAQVSSTDIRNNVCGGTAGTLNPDSTGCATDTNTAGFNRIIATIIRYFSLIVGVVSVIMIIIGGLKYITSGGDAGKITSAKNTILYALIGLIIVALAQVIVRFVLQNVGA